MVYVFERFDKPLEPFARLARRAHQGAGKRINGERRDIPLIHAAAVEQRHGRPFSLSDCAKFVADYGSLRMRISDSHGSPPADRPYRLIRNKERRVGKEWR